MLRSSRPIAIASVMSVLVASVSAFAQTGEMETKESAPAPNLVARRLGLNADQMPVVNAEQAALAKAIGKEVVCLCGTCPKHTITDCDCGWAGMNKRILQHAVSRGMTREQIVGTYREAYGDQVLAMLPNEGFARLAWVLPYSAGAFGLALVFFVGVRHLRRSKNRDDDTGAPSGAPVGALNEEHRRALAKELEELD